MRKPWTRGFEDLVIPATLVNPLGPPAAATYDPDWANIVFPDGSTSVIDVSYQIPHSAILGTSAILHMHWQPSNTNTGAASFTIQYQWRNNNAAAVGVAVASWAATTGTLTPGGVANVLQSGDLCTLTFPTGMMSSCLQVRISRTGGTDAFTGDVRLISIDAHIQLDSLGSEAVLAK